MKKISLLAAAPAILLTAPVLAQSADVARVEIQEEFAGSRLSFDSVSGLSNYTLRVSGPNGYFGQVYSDRTAPSFRLADHGDVEDGLYTYEITAATSVYAPRPASEMGLDNGRSAEARPRVGTSRSGSFRVVNGQILELDPSVTE